MFYVYVLKSEKVNKLYIGSTGDLKIRLKEHNSGNSRFTKIYRPWKLVYYEAYCARSLAIKRENQLKRFAKAFAMLKRRIGL